jgi:hypothetical protein
MTVSRLAVRYISLAAGAAITTAVAAAYLIPLALRRSFAGNLRAGRQPSVHDTDA